MNNLSAPGIKSLNQRIGVLPLWVILLTFSWAALDSFFSLPKELEWGVFIFLMLILGIPHGAADHLVFFSKSSSSGSGTKTFFQIYLGIMLLYSLLWYLLPSLAFILFLAFSAYHFGESQLYYLAQKAPPLLQKALFFTWGLSVLYAILGFHSEASLAILDSTPFQVLLSYSLQYFTLFFSIGLGTCLAILVYLHFWKDLSLRVLSQEILLLGLLFFLFLQSSLLVSFGIYFALWHSLSTIEQEIKYFRQHQSPDYSWKNYRRDASLFSLISFIGIGLILGLLAFTQWSGSSVLFIFFVLISILTAPHAYLISNIYPDK